SVPRALGRAHRALACGQGRDLRAEAGRVELTACRATERAALRVAPRQARLRHATAFGGGAGPPLGAAPGGGTGRACARGERIAAEAVERRCADGAIVDAGELSAA